MAKILVAGGAGFIGSHLCKKLLDNDNEVICLDNFSTGRRENILPFLKLKNKNFKLIEHDVTKEVFLDCDEIYNLACPASPLQYQLHPIETIKSAFLGTLNLLELSLRNDAKILLASTSEIYGDPKIHPQREDYFGYVNPIGPRSCYDEGKRASETLMFDYHRQKNAKIKVVRIFNTYGPNMDVNDGRVVSNFIIQALLNKDITVYDKGLQTRSFCYVDDMTEGLIKMMAAKNNILGPINLGNPYEQTILELAKLIITLTDSKSKIIYLKKPQDDPIRRKPDIKKATDELDFKINIDIEEGLKRTIDYFKKTLSI